MSRKGDKHKFSQLVQYKDMIKNKVLDEWLDEDTEAENKPEEGEELGDYDISRYNEED